MIYARAHDSQVAEDYFAAMAKVEGRLGAGARDVLEPKLESSNGIQPLMALVDQLKEASLKQDDKERILVELQDLLLASQSALERL